MKEQEASLEEIEKIYKKEIPEDSVEYIKADVDGQELTWRDLVRIGCAFICQNNMSTITDIRIKYKDETKTVKERLKQFTN